MNPSGVLTTWPHVTALSARLKASEHLLRIAAVDLPDGPLHDRIVGFLSRKHEQEINDREFVGYCESCGKVICEGDGWYSDERNEGGCQLERPVGLTTPNGSTVEISGKHKGIFKIDFDWCEEDACCDCQVDIDASRETGWTRLIWGCSECRGGQAPLGPEEA